MRRPPLGAFPGALLQEGAGGDGGDGGKAEQMKALTHFVAPSAH